ncbi:MAG: hypothetical protein ACRDVL_06330 [Acidimicrobiia bacterium]
MTALLILEGVVILLLLILVAGLLKSHAEILRQLHRLGVSTESGLETPSRGARTTGFAEAPTVELTGVDLSGATRTVTLEGGRHHTLLAFLSSGCASCITFWEALDCGLDLPGAETRTVVVTKGPTSESPGRLSELAPAKVPVILSDEMWDLFRVPITPYFLLVDSDARIVGEGSATTPQQLVGLLRQSAADSGDPTHMDTRARQDFTDSQLSRSGIEPGDSSLYEDPLDR